jgi:PhnB protein
MASKVKAKPDGYRTVTPYLVVPDAAKLIDFTIKAFDGKQVRRHNMPDGKVAHAEVAIGDSMVMIGNSGDQWPGLKAGIHLYVDDVDAVYRRALAAGATSEREPADQMYGDRSAGVKDFAGNSWWLATHIEDVSDEEMSRRAQEASKKAK